MCKLSLVNGCGNPIHPGFAPDLGLSSEIITVPTLLTICMILRQAGT
jgi:hypothetical protein